MLDTFDKYARDITTLVDELEPLRDRIRATRRTNDEDLTTGSTTTAEIVHGPRGTGEDIKRVHEIKAELKIQWAGLFGEIDELLKEP